MQLVRYSPVPLSRCGGRRYLPLAALPLAAALAALSSVCSPPGTMRQAVWPLVLAVHLVALPQQAMAWAPQAPPLRVCSAAYCRAPRLAATAAASAPLEDDEAAARKRENAEIVGLAGPALVSTLIDPLLSLIDAMWVGRIGSPFALGATAASSELFTLAFAASLALREASSSSIARLAAAGRAKDAATFSRRTLQLAGVCGLFLALLIGGPTAKSAVSLMGAQPGSPLHGDALAYARSRALFLPFALAGSAAEGAYRGYGDTRTPLRAAALAAIVNAVLDPLFIFAPLKMGVAGAALATGVAQLVYTSVLLFGGLRAKLTAGSGATATDVASAADEAESPAESPAGSAVFGTSAATLLRSSSILGCWVYIASAVSRLLGPTAIAAHGVVLKVWLLFVLAAEAPAVAAQVLCARRLSLSQKAAARALLHRMLRLGAILGVFAMVSLLIIAAPAARFFFPTDAAAVLTATSLFSYAAFASLLTVPTVICEAVLTGAGSSYAYLAFSTLANAIIVSVVTGRALSAPGATPVAAWRCIVLFFSLRLTSAALRVFRSPKGGLKGDDGDAPLLDGGVD